MTLQTRTLLIVTLLIVFAVLATTVVLTWAVRGSILAQTEADGIVIARLLARSAGFAYQVPRDVEEEIGEQMIVQATIAAHLVAVAEQAGLTPDEINAHLRDITNHTALNEFWITDEKGHAYLRNTPEIDFTFDPDPQKQPQAHMFWSLISGEKSVVVQEARQREVDTNVFKYVGVSGVDKPRIVQIGYNVSLLNRIQQQVGLNRLIGDLLNGGDVSAIRVVDDDLTILNFGVARGVNIGAEISSTERAYLMKTVALQQTQSYDDGALLKVMSPIFDADNHVIGVVAVSLPTENAQISIQKALQFATVVAVVVLIVGVAASAVLTRRVTKPVERLTDAAAAVESGTFTPESLTGIAARTDELGQLARVFQRMAEGVKAREEQLRRQVETLRIEIDETKKAQQVAEITDTEYFRELRDKARQLREKRSR